MQLYLKKRIGKIGEELTCKYLEQKGYSIIKRNFYCKQGEIDIIAKENNEIIFIEVKTRTNAKFGNPADAVNFLKQKHIYNTAKYFLYKTNIENMSIRFDVIEVLIRNDNVRFHHIKQII